MTPLETYLAGVDPRAVPVVRALDAAIRRAHPEFDAAIKYRILMYSINAEWRTWVVSINAVKNRVGLQFLYGVLLDDPRGVLRAGTSILKTWDFAFDARIDADAVSSYVSERSRSTTTTRPTRRASWRRARSGNEGGTQEALALPGPISLFRPAGSAA